MKMPMDMKVIRYTSDTNTTLSLVFVDGIFFTYGLEDEFREEKIRGETRIPRGKYRITVRAEGGFHNRYTKKFGKFHQGMLWVRDVPGFEWILIHVGNTEKDTAGCLLVGSGVSSAKRLMITRSVPAYKKLYAKVIEAAKADNLTIEYIDGDINEDIAA